MYLITMLWLRYDHLLSCVLQQTVPWHLPLQKLLNPVPQTFMISCVIICPSLWTKTKQLRNNNKKNKTLFFIALLKVVSQSVYNIRNTNTVNIKDQQTCNKNNYFYIFLMFSASHRPLSVSPVVEEHVVASSGCRGKNKTRTWPTKICLAAAVIKRGQK